ncbi:MAG: DUF3068 domain-containing protein [Candidatus Poseidoniia archaeon]|nr:DUF3068 domain-containing protein [Candidatus Poseidoniia archaeon]
MSNMNLPEWTAQALVAAGAVFLLISAYVMGVMVPNGLLAPNDFDVDYYFEGDIKTFDLDTETGTGVFVDDVGSGSYEPTKAKDGGGATLTLVGRPSGDEYTLLSQNFSLTTDGIDGDGVWLGTIADTSDNPALLNRKTYEIDGKQGAWTPTNLPEEGKEYVFPNPVNGDYDDTFTCSDKRMLDGVEVMTCVAEPEAGTKMTFVPGEGSDLALLKNTFEGRNSAAGPGSAPMWFSYRTEQIVGTELGGVIDRVYNVTVYMQAPTMVYLDDNFTTVTYYEGEVGGIDVSDPFFGADYYNATGKKGGYVNPNASNADYINVTGFLNLFAIQYDENGTAIPTDYDNVDSDDPNSTFQEALVNTTYDVNRISLQYLQADGSDSFTFFSPTCTTISVVDSTCWVPAENQSWPNPFSSLKTVPDSGGVPMNEPYMQNYTFMGEDPEYQVNGVPSYHFQANETDICCFFRAFLGDMNMSYYEDVWVDPVTGTVLNQHYDVQLRYQMLILGWKIIRDIDAKFTEEQINASISSAKLQALAQYYQGHDMVVLTLNGAYTEKTVDGQIDAEKDKVASYTLGTVTLPAILIGLAMVSLMAGFYVYYQTGGAISSGGMDEPSSEAEPSSSMATVEEESTEDEAADDSSDGDSDAEEESEDSSDGDEESDSEDDNVGDLHSSRDGGFG